VLVVVAGGADTGACGGSQDYADDEEAEEEAGVGGLRGFRASSQRLTPAKWYAPPQVPADYRPFHYFETSLYADGKPSPQAQPIPCVQQSYYSVHSLHS
jgi:hypothetical protein